MTEPNTTDNSESALEALREAKAALEGLHGKTITVIRRAGDDGTEPAGTTTEPR